MYFNGEEGGIDTVEYIELHEGSEQGESEGLIELDLESPNEAPPIPTPTSPPFEGQQ